jgi:hypothetical protein
MTASGLASNLKLSRWEIILSPPNYLKEKIDEERAVKMYEELKRRVQGVLIFSICAILGEGVPDLRVGLRTLMDGTLDPQQNYCRLRLDLSPFKY